MLVKRLVFNYMCMCTVRGSCRQLSIHNVDNLSQPLSVSEINIAPGLLVPYFDEDINVVFLAAKVCRSVTCVSACTGKHMYTHTHTRTHKSKAFWLLLSSHPYPMTSTGALVCYSGTVSQCWQILLEQD